MLRKYESIFSMVANITPLMNKERFNRTLLLNTISQAHEDLCTSLKQLEEVKADKGMILGELQDLDAILGPSDVVDQQFEIQA